MFITFVDETREKKLKNMRAKYVSLTQSERAKISQKNAASRNKRRAKTNVDKIAIVDESHHSGKI